MVAVASDVLRAEPGPTLRDLLNRTGGNPLFITELLAGLLLEQVVRFEAAHAELVEATLPPPLKLTILRQLGRLSAECLQTVRIAAVLGSTFPAEDLATALHTSVAELVVALAEATHASVFTEENGELSFRHDLVREAIYDDLSPSVRKALHREVGRALANADAPSTRVATHFALGASDGDGEAIGWLRHAARDAAPRAPPIAVELLERAAAIGGPEVDDVLAELSEALVWAGRPSEGAALIRDLLPHLSDTALEVQLRSCLATTFLFDGRPSESAAEFEAAARLPGVGAANTPA